MVSPQTFSVNRIIRSYTRAQLLIAPQMFWPSARVNDPEFACLSAVLANQGVGSATSLNTNSSPRQKMTTNNRVCLLQ